MNVHQLEWIIWVVAVNLFEVFLIFKFKKKSEHKTKETNSELIEKFKEKYLFSNNNLIISILNKYNICIF